MAAAILAITCAAQQVFAAALSVSPTVINDDVSPGKKINGRIQIANTGNSLMTVQISSEIKVPFSSQTAKNNDWLKLKQTVVSLKPGEKKNIDYSLSAGRKDSGEAMAIIFFNEKGPNTAVMSRIGAVLYAKIKGTEVMNAEIDDIKIKKDRARGDNGGFGYA